MAASVGSVSIRVRPDSTGFKAELEAELAKIGDLKIKVTPELDTAKLRAQLAALNSKDIKIPAEVDVNQDELGRVLAGIKKIHIPAKIDVDTSGLAKARTAIDAAIPNSKTVKVRIDNPQLGALTSAFSRTFSGIQSAGSRAFSALRTAGTNAAANISDAFAGVGDLAGLVPGLLKVSGIASLIAVGGAAITAAWGAASTAVAAVPAAIGLIGAPIAAVMLGMDGIKQAAKALAPEFDKLKKSVSDTFQSQLTPVFNQLKGVMTALTPQVQAVATSMAGLAQQTANWITQQGGLQIIQTTFSNIAAAIGNINLVPLVDGFIRLAGNNAALQALTTTINELGVQIQAIANNPALDQAFKGLEGTLQAVTKGFGDLVNNGIKLFAAAAPGVNAVVNSITGFFNRFDWNSLGTSVSGVFSGIATAIDGIKPSTIKGIETAFQGLSDVFKDPAFQANIQKVADALPAVINQVASLTRTFGDFAGGAAQLTTAFDTIDQGFQKVQRSINQFASDLGTSVFGNTPDPLGLNALNNWINEKLGITVPQTITQGVQRSTQAAEHETAILGEKLQTGFTTAFSTATTTARDGLAQVPVVTQEELGKVGPLFSQLLGTAPQIALEKFGLVPPAAQQALAPVVPTVANALTPAIGIATTTAQGVVTGWVGGLGGLVTGSTAAAQKVPPAILTPIEILAQKLPIVGSKAGSSFGTGLNSGLSAGLANTVPVVGQGFVPIAGAATDGTQAAVDAVNAVLPGVGTAFQSAFTNLQGLATTAFTGLTAQFTNFGTTLTTFGQAFTTLIPQITQFGQAFTTLNPALLAFGTTFTTLNPAILAFGTTFTTLIPQITAFGTAFTTLNPALLAFGTTFATLNPALLAFGTTFTTLVPQITAFGLAFTTLNPALLAFGTTFATLNPALLAFGTSLATINPAILAFGTTLTTLNPALLAFGTAFTTLNPQITAFGAALGTVTPALTAITTGLTAAVASLTTFTTALTTATTAVTTFATTVTTAITTAMTAMVTAVTDGSAKMVEAMTKAMTDITTAVTKGMTDAVAAVKKGVADVIAALNAAAGPAKTAGENLGQAFVDGINSKIAAARAAGVALGKAAADGINSQKGISSASPSKKGIASGEFLGVGVIIGLRNMLRSVVAAAANLGAEAAAALHTEFSGGLDDLSGDLRTRLSGAVRASVAVGGDGASSGDVILHNVFQVGTEAVEEIFHKLDRGQQDDLLLKLRAA